MNDLLLTRTKGALLVNLPKEEEVGPLERSSRPKTLTLSVGMSQRQPGTIGGLINLKFDGSEVDPKRIREFLASGLQSAIELGLDRPDQIGRDLDSKVL